MKRREYLTNIGKVRKSGAIKHTFATTFLLPTIGYCEKDFNNNLINVYIDEDLETPTLVLVIDINTFFTDDMLKRLEKNPIYAGFEKFDSEIVIKFRVPLKHHDTFRKFINGKYSEFNNEYKQVLTNIYGYKVNTIGKLVTEYDIIYPRKDKRKQIAEELSTPPNSIIDYTSIKEVFDRPDMEYEIYQSLQQIKEQQVHE